MKTKALFLCLFAAQLSFADSKQVYNGNVINIGAEAKEKVIDNPDQELEFFEKELENIQSLKKGFKKKAVVLDKLNSEAKTLNKNHRKYAKKKLKYNSYIDKYQAQQECINKTKDVDKCFGKEEKISKDFLEQFNRIMLAKKDSFQRCYQKQLGENKNTKGQVKFLFRFLPSGQIEHIGVVDHLKGSNKNLIRCIYANINSTPFPKTGEDDKITIAKLFYFNVKKS